MGNGVSYLVGPYVVPFSEEPHSNTTDPIAVERTRKDIQNYMIGDAVTAAVIFLLFLAYFPAKPHKPPCASSAVTRVDFRKGWKGLVTNTNAWFVCLAYAIPAAVQASWQTLMAVNFEHLPV